MQPEPTREKACEEAGLAPVYGGVLIGGGSTRMGTPKHLLRAGQRTFLEHVVAALEPCVSRLVLLGSGEVPEQCRHLTRLADPPGLAGPLAGMLAAMRWNRDVAWLIAACDLPFVTPAAVAWLLEQRAPGRQAILPRLHDRGVEPLLALYEPQARPLLEELASTGIRAPHRVAEHEFVFTPAPPADLARAWQNVNTPGDLENLS